MGRRGSRAGGMRVLEVERHIPRSKGGHGASSAPRGGAGRQATKVSREGKARPRESHALFEVPLSVHCPTDAHHVGERLLQWNFWRCRRGSLQATRRPPTRSGWRLPHGRCAWWRVPSAGWIPSARRLLPTAPAAGVRWHAARRWWLLWQCASSTSVYPASATRRW